MIGGFNGLCTLCALVGFSRDLKTLSSSMAERWILNKSMPCDWTLEPLLNENHCSEISILPLSPLLSLSISHPLLCLYRSHHFYFPSLWFLSPLALRPQENMYRCAHTYTSSFFFLFSFFPECLHFIFPEDIFRQPNVRPSSGSPVCVEALPV